MDGIYVAPNQIRANQNRKKNSNMKGDYPVGAKDDSRAPYNEDNGVEVECTVSLTVSATLTLKVNENYTKEDLKEAARPFIDVIPAGEDNWCVDDFEVIEE